MVDTVEVETKRESSQRIKLLARNIFGFVHLLKHDIAAVQRPLRVAHRVEIRRIFNHSNQQGSLMYVKVVGGGVEIHLCRALDAYRVVKEIKLVEIHLDDLFFAVETLELDGDHPLDRFLHGAADKAGTWRCVQLFGELLGDGRTTSGAFLPQ